MEEQMKMAKIMYHDFKESFDAMLEANYQNGKELSEVVTAVGHLAAKVDDLNTVLSYLDAIATGLILVSDAINSANKKQNEKEEQTS
ncbi:MAG: hypothetical protein IJP92_02685 [Lachnospiraceae bacterium]|nr:hypothetical protein [Lachnospiraceae bacterium]